MVHTKSLTGFHLQILRYRPFPAQSWTTGFVDQPNFLLAGTSLYKNALNYNNSIGECHISVSTTAKQLST